MCCSHYYVVCLCVVRVPQPSTLLLLNYDRTRARSSQHHPMIENSNMNAIDLTGDDEEVSIEQREEELMVRGDDYSFDANAPVGVNLTVDIVDLYSDDSQDEHEVDMQPKLPQHKLGVSASETNSSQAVPPRKPPSYTRISNGTCPESIMPSKNQKNRREMDPLDVVKRRNTLNKRKRSMDNKIPDATLSNQNTENVVETKKNKISPATDERTSLSITSLETDGIKHLKPIRPKKDQTCHRNETNEHSHRPREARPQDNETNFDQNVVAPVRISVDILPKRLNAITLKREFSKNPGFLFASVEQKQSLATTQRIGCVHFDTVINALAAMSAVRNIPYNKKRSWTRRLVLANFQGADIGARESKVLQKCRGASHDDQTIRSDSRNSEIKKDVDGSYQHSITEHCQSSSEVEQLNETLANSADALGASSLGQSTQADFNVSKPAVRAVSVANEDEANRCIRKRSNVDDGVNNYWYYWRCRCGLKHDVCIRPNRLRSLPKVFASGLLDKCNGHKLRILFSWVDGFEFAWTNKDHSKGIGTCQMNIGFLYFDTTANAQKAIAQVKQRPSKDFPMNLTLLVLEPERGTVREAEESCRNSVQTSFEPSAIYKFDVNNAHIKNENPSVLQKVKKIIASADANQGDDSIKPTQATCNKNKEKTADQVKTMLKSEKNGTLNPSTTCESVPELECVEPSTGHKLDVHNAGGKNDKFLVPKDQKKECIASIDANEGVNSIQTIKGANDYKEGKRRDFEKNKSVVKGKMISPRNEGISKSEKTSITCKHGVDGKYILLKANRSTAGGNEGGCDNRDKNKFHIKAKYELPRKVSSTDTIGEREDVRESIHNSVDQSKPDEDKLSQTFSQETKILKKARQKGRGLQRNLEVGTSTVPDEQIPVGGTNTVDVVEEKELAGSSYRPRVHKVFLPETIEIECSDDDSDAVGSAPPPTVHDPKLSLMKKRSHPTLSAQSNKSQQNVLPRMNQSRSSLKPPKFKPNASKCRKKLSYFCSNFVPTSIEKHQAAQHRAPPSDRPPASTVPNFIFPNSNKYRADVEYNYSTSISDAREEQERLFEQARIRVRADAILRQMPSGRGKFVAPVEDVTKLDSEHWKWPDLYARLGLPTGSSILLVKKQYRRLALVYHPDKNLKHSDTTLRFQAVTEAYQKLTKG